METKEKRKGKVKEGKTGKRAQINIIIIIILQHNTQKRLENL